MRIFKRILCILGTVVCLTILILLGIKGYNYLSERKIQEINDSYIELTREQLDKVNSTFSILKTLSDETQDLFVTEEVIASDKSGFCDEDFKSGLEDFNTTFKDHSELDAIRYFMSFCDFSVNYDATDITIWSEKYNHLTTVEVNLQYPDFDRIIKYNLVRDLAQKGIKEEVLSINSSVVKDYFAEHYDTYTLSTSINVPLFITDDGEFKYFTDWVSSIPYIRQILEYSSTTVSLSEDDSDDYKTVTNAINLINERNIDAILTNLIKMSDGEEKEILKDIKEENQSVKEGLINSILVMGDLEYSAITKDVVAVDETESTSGILVAVPYYNIEIGSAYLTTSVLYLEDDTAELIWGSMRSVLIMAYNLDKGV